MDAPMARGQDFLILLLDLGRRERRISVDPQACWEAYGGVTAECPALALLEAPGFHQRFYWRLLGYRAP